MIRLLRIQVLFATKFGFEAAVALGNPPRNPPDSILAIGGTEDG